MKHICVAGKNEIAISILAYLKNKHKDSNFLYIRNKNDHGEDSWQPSFHSFARKEGIKETNLEELYELEDLVFFSMEFDRIIKPELFKTKELFNIHFSALPQYKGMFTSALPLLHGEEFSGVTLHKIDAGIDTGDIIDQLIFPIKYIENSEILYKTYMDYGISIVIKNIDNLVSGKYDSTPQSSRNSSYYSKKTIDYSNLEIDYNKTAEEIRNQFRAFTFRPYQMMKFGEWEIYKTSISTNKSNQKPKTIIDEDDCGITIATIDFDITLYKDYYKQFWEAAKNGDLKKIKEIIPYVPEIDLRNKKGWNALILAVYNNHLALAQYLLEQGANPNGVNYKGTNITMYALSCLKNTGDSRMLELVLTHKPDLEKTDTNGLNIFQYDPNNLLEPFV
ncbi:MAG: formyltransferase family protein [Flavobacteriales bacterium]|jgi:methionyl-tRNA formyltransferase|nr:formyltransferase family protein [Flavobacteriales bacterium]